MEHYHDMVLSNNENVYSDFGIKIFLQKMNNNTTIWNTIMICYFQTMKMFIRIFGIKIFLKKMNNRTVMWNTIMIWYFQTMKMFIRIEFKKINEQMPEMRIQRRRVKDEKKVTSISP